MREMRSLPRSWAHWSKSVGIKLRADGSSKECTARLAVLAASVTGLMLKRWNVQMAGQSEGNLRQLPTMMLNMPSAFRVRRGNKSELRCSMS